MLSEFQFHESNVDDLIKEIAACESGKEIMTLERLGVSDDACQDMYRCAALFRADCQRYLAQKSNSSTLTFLSRETELYKLAKELAYDAWQNEPEPSAQEILRAYEERREDVRAMQRIDR